MRQLNQHESDGALSVSSPGRSTAAAAGAVVLLTAILAFNLGLSAEWHRPMPEKGEPIAAVQAVALNADQIPALMYLPGVIVPEAPTLQLAAAVAPLRVTPVRPVALAAYRPPASAPDALSPAVQADTATIVPAVEPAPRPAAPAPTVDSLLAAY